MAVCAAHLLSVFLLTSTSTLGFVACQETSVTEEVLPSPATVSFTALTSVRFTTSINVSPENQTTMMVAQPSSVHTIDTPSPDPEPTVINSISSDESSAIVDTPTPIPETADVNNISSGSSDRSSAIVDTPTSVPEATDESSSTALIAWVVVGTLIGVVSVMALVIVGVVIMARRRISARSQMSWTPGSEALSNPTFTGNSTYPVPGSLVNPNYEYAVNLLPGDQISYESPLSYETPVSRLTPIRPGNEYTDSSEMHKGIYVPTLEQRAAYHYQDPDNNVYNTLSLGHSVGYSSVNFFEEQDTYWAPASTYEGLYEQLWRFRYREIPRTQIRILGHLGSGQFGVVDKGLWETEAMSVKAAVKTLHKGAAESDRVHFLQEAAIMGQFYHPNVVKLLGVVTLGEPVTIVLELLEGGDLRCYLLNLNGSPGEVLPPGMSQMCLQFCIQIASGMEYLSKKAFVHRDLAARNILLSDQKTCKIADFGMARDLQDENYYVSHGGKIPVKWTAPEALHYKKYSTASDIWSYGALMYEIWTLGHKPFEGHTNMQVLRLLARGYRLPPPPGCSRGLYELMMHCWHPESRSRPSFSDLLQSLSRPETELLHWTEEDTKTHPQAAVLGALLEAGKDLYPDLQDAYLDQ